MTTTPLGPRLAVFRDYAACDSRHAHEVGLITDGLTSTGTARAAWDLGAVSRDGVVLEADCPDPIHDQEMAPALLRWRLDVDAWTADADAIALLDQHGIQVER